MDPDRGTNWRLRTQVVLAGLGTALVVGAVVWRRDLENADHVAAVVGALFNLAAVLLTKRDHTSTEVTEEVLDCLREDVHVQWDEEADQRDLLGNDLIPLALRQPSKNPRTPTRIIAPHRGLATVASQDFRHAWARWFACLPSHVLIWGAPGTGKTTLALMATLGLTTKEPRTTDEVGPQPAPGPVPVLISLAAWEPGRESLMDWLNTRLDLAAPTAMHRLSRAGEGGRANRLLTSGRVLLILDGLDELDHEATDALRIQLRRLLISCPVMMLSRGRPSPGSWLTQDFTVYELRKPSTKQSIAYLQKVEPPQLSPDEPLLHELLEDQPSSGLRELLTVPLRQYVVRKAIERGYLTTSRLREAAMGGKRDIRDLFNQILLRHVRRQIESSAHLRAVDGGRFAQALAQRLEDRRMYVFAWWRFGDLVPASVFTACTSLMAAPGYRLATIMPVGLTRGLTIGLMAGIYLGVLREVKISAVSVVVAAFVTSACVVAVGAPVLGWHQVLADSVEITTAAVATLLGLQNLRSGRLFRQALPRLLWIGFLTGVVTSAFSTEISFHDQDRGLVSIMIAGWFGVGVAVVAARLLLPDGPRMAPSRVQIGRGKRKMSFWRLIPNGVISAMAVGLGGGLGGAVRYHLDYGLALSLVFGLAVGIPVGLVGGLIRYLSAPLKSHSGVAGSATLWADRITALGTIIAITLSAVSGVLVIATFLDGTVGLINRESTNSPLHATLECGLLFGLTIGSVVAGFNAAWPAFTIAHKWLFLNGRMPWQIEVYLEKLRHVEVLRKEGGLLAFRHREYQRALADAGRNQP